eukprot:GHVN01039899.1.p1 GENE.GHVN01039899.1~~GHVN01039899.1.p1  ORF type:complete len:335 (-),score=114.40 GHVN01039899.1:729-1733(-)
MERRREGNEGGDDYEEVEGDGAIERGEAIEGDEAIEGGEGTAGGESDGESVSAVSSRVSDVGGQTEGETYESPESDAGDATNDEKSSDKESSAESESSEVSGSEMSVTEPEDGNRLEGSEDVDGGTQLSEVGDELEQSEETSDVNEEVSSSSPRHPEQPHSYMSHFTKSLNRYTTAQFERPRGGIFPPSPDSPHSPRSPKWSRTPHVGSPRTSSLHFTVEKRVQPLIAPSRPVTTVFMPKPRVPRTESSPPNPPVYLIHKSPHSKQQYAMSRLNTRTPANRADSTSELHSRSSSPRSLDTPGPPDSFASHGTGSYSRYYTAAEAQLSDSEESSE